MSCQWLGVSITQECISDLCFLLLLFFFSVLLLCGTLFPLFICANPSGQFVCHRCLHILLVIICSVSFKLYDLNLVLFISSQTYLLIYNSTCALALDPGCFMDAIPHRNCIFLDLFMCSCVFTPVLHLNI